MTAIIVQPIFPCPLHTLFLHIQPILSMQHVVKYATHEKDVVDSLPLRKNDRDLQEHKSPFRDAKETLNVLPHALQPRAPCGVIRVSWILRLYWHSPLRQSSRKSNEQWRSRQKGCAGFDCLARCFVPGSNSNWMDISQSFHVNSWDNAVCTGMMA